MSKAYVEIDFFQMEKRRNASSLLSPRREVLSSSSSAFRGIQDAVCRMNPQLLKTIMSVGNARSSDDIPAWAPSQPDKDPANVMSSCSPSPSRTASPPQLPVFYPASRSSPCSSSPATDTAPLTIFYNGIVSTFDVPRDKAEAIIRMAAETGVVGNQLKEMPVYSVLHDNQVEGDLPIARKKSLHRFLEKRKERLASASPYFRVGPSCPC